MRCSVENCNSYCFDKKKLSFHTFPVKEETHNLWKKQLGFDPTYVITPKIKVCSLHFRPDDIIKKIVNYKPRCYLRPGTVPVLHSFQHPKVMEEKAVCRLCLSSTKALKCVLDKTYDTMSYLTIYFEVVGIHLTEYPSFPRKICKDCDNQLIRAYRFLEKCSATEQHIQKLQNEGNQDVSDEFLRPPYLEEENETLTSEITIEQEIKEETMIPEEEMNVASEKSKNEELRSHPIFFERDEEMTIKQEIKEEVVEEPTEVLEITETECTESSVANESCAKRTNITIKIIQCKKCTEIFEEMEAFQKHSCRTKRKEFLLPPKQDSESFACDKCGQSYANRLTLEKHLDQYHKKVLSCPSCHLTFRSYQHQKIHKRLAHPEYPTDPTFQCSHCGKKFTSRTCLIEHINHDHLIFSEFHCEICGKKERTQKLISNHKRNSHPENRHQCKICSKEFNSKHSLNAHLRTHDKKMCI